MSNNRYRFVDAVKNENGKRVYNSSYLPSIPVGDNDVYIITRMGDRLDMFASRYYDDVTLWWIIALANNLTDCAVEPGIKLRIPANAETVLSLVEQVQTVG